MTSLTLGDLRFAVQRSSRRRTLGLTVERDGSLVLSAPPDVEDARLERFAKQKRLWIYKKLASRRRCRRRSPRASTSAAKGCHTLGVRTGCSWSRSRTSR
jgi:predicted metal-dependent hydrolase